MTRTKLAPIVAGFLATALQDLQYSEDDEACMEEREARDTGTIYDCPDETHNRAVSECDAFLQAALEATLVSEQGYEQIGSDLYMELAGHGVGFYDREHDEDRDTSRAIGEALSAAVSGRSSLEMYLGDDGKAYFA